MRVAVCVSALVVAACGSPVGVPCDVVLSPVGLAVNEPFTKEVCVDNMCREVEDSVQVTGGTTLLVAYGEAGSEQTAAEALVPGFETGVLDGAERIVATIVQGDARWDWSGEVEGLVPAECVTKVIDVAPQ